MKIKRFLFLRDWSQLHDILELFIHISQGKSSFLNIFHHLLLVNVQLFHLNSLLFTSDCAHRCLQRYFATPSIIFWKEKVKKNPTIHIFGEGSTLLQNKPSPDLCEPVKRTVSVQWLAFLSFLSVKWFATDNKNTFLHFIIGLRSNQIKRVHRNWLVL